MLKKLLILSLVAIPFYEVLLHFLIPGRAFPLLPDMRITKDFMSMGFASVIGSVVLVKYGFKKISNIWLPIFVCFLVFNLSKAPGEFIINNIDMAGIWNNRPAYKIIVYLFFFLGVSSLPKLDVKAIFKTISYCGLAMAVIMGLQRLGLDQIFTTLPFELIGQPKHPEMGGTLGNVTLSAPFITMAIPFMLYQKKWLYALFMSFIVILSGSSFALAGLCATLIVFTFLNIKIKAIPVIALMSAVSLGVFFFIHRNPDFLQANGRYEVWKAVIYDIFNGRIALTGAGIGAFKYIFRHNTHTHWLHAHNDYLQLIWSCGLIGAGIVFFAVKDLLKKALKNLNSENKTILASFVGIGVVSVGTFVLQLSAFQYYLVIMAGIIYQIDNGGHYEQCN